MNLRGLLWAMVLTGLAWTAEAQRYFPDGIMLSNEYVRQQGLVDLQAWTGGEVTNENVRGLGVSLGQLSGINPETGGAILDPTNLVPLVARTLRVSGDSILEGSLDMSGSAIHNAAFAGNGAGLTNIPATAITETDPVWAAASNAVATGLNARLLSSTWAAADATTNYLPRTGGMMSGALDMGGQAVTNASYYGDGGGLTNLAVSPVARPVNAIGTSHVLANEDCDVFSTNSYETLVSLPTAGPATVGRVYHVSNLGAGLLQVCVTNGTDQINGVVRGSLAIGQNGSLRIVGATASQWIANQ